MTRCQATDPLTLHQYDEGASSGDVGHTCKNKNIKPSTSVVLAPKVVGTELANIQNPVKIFSKLDAQ